MAYGVISLALRRTGTTLRRVLDGFEISRGDINEEEKEKKYRRPLRDGKKPHWTCLLH